jgi:hypothetical protein
MSEKSLQERFNYWDVPRDGRVSNPLMHPKTAIEEFLLDAAVSAYVVVPRKYWIWLMENGLAHASSKIGFFTALPMTEGNMKGGVVGKVGSAMVFSDVYAHPDKSYPENTLIHFAQMDGEYMRELEHSRCPYFRVNRSEGIGAEIDIPEFNELDFLGAWYKHNTRETQVKSLSMPARYWAAFYLWIVTTRENEYVVNHDPASQLDGHHGLYRGVPVYTDAFLVEGLRDKNSLIYLELEKVSA